MARTVQSEDYRSTELDGVVDFAMLRTGGPLRVDPVGEREFKDIAEYEKFMAEQVVIRIHSTPDKNEPPAAFIGENGAGVWIPRNVKVRLPRSYVETLARSQSRSYRTDRNPDPNADEGMVTKTTSGACYPFEVLQDPNPRGRAWLQRVTHESA